MTTKLQTKYVVNEQYTVDKIIEPIQEITDFKINVWHTVKIKTCTFEHKEDPKLICNWKWLSFRLDIGNYFTFINVKSPLLTPESPFFDSDALLHFNKTFGSIDPNYPQANQTFTFKISDNKIKGFLTTKFSCVKFKGEVDLVLNRANGLKGQIIELDVEPII